MQLLGVSKFAWMVSVIKFLMMILDNLLKICCFSRETKYKNTTNLCEYKNGKSITSLLFRVM